MLEIRSKLFMTKQNIEYQIRRYHLMSKICIRVRSVIVEDVLNISFLPTG